MARERIAIISLYPLGSLGGGEFFTLNTLKAVATTGVQCRLYAIKEAIPKPQPTAVRLQAEFIRAFDSESRERPAPLKFSELLAECADFDTIWVHQHMSNDLIFDFIASVSSDQTLLLTNLGHEPLRGLFSQLYQASPNHWSVEISNYSESRATNYMRQRIGISAAVWKKDCHHAIATPRAFQRRACVIGRVLPHKGVEVTIEGLPKDFELNIIGGIELDSEYTEHLKKSANGRQVNFLGAQDEAAKRNVLEGSDVLIASSCVTLYNGRQIEQAELLGLVLLEAVAAGVQPISSDLPPFREVMEKLGLEEFIYPQRDSAALERILRRYESFTPAQQAKLRQRAHDRMQEHFLFDDYWKRVSHATGLPGAE
jgi:glycosyltransferase involved in cell wall biosynthesis